MSARQDNNFLEMLRALPTRATPRWVTSDARRDEIILHTIKTRRAQGLRARIRNARGVVSILRGTE